MHQGRVSDRPALNLLPRQIDGQVRSKGFQLALGRIGCHRNLLLSRLHDAAALFFCGGQHALLFGLGAGICLVAHLRDLSIEAGKTLFHIRQMEEGFVKQADLLVDATTVVRDAVSRLRARNRKLSDLSKLLIDIHHKESVGDDNHHAAMSRLFDGSTDPLDVIKWKELYDYIEEAIDGCEDVGNTLERIVLKNG